VAVFVDLEGRGQPVVCFASGRDIQVVSLEGQTLKTVRRTLPKLPDIRPVSSEPDPVTNRQDWLASRLLCLFSGALQGEGTADLICPSDGHVQAYGGERQQPRWQWQVPDPLTGILDVMPAGPDQPAIVFVQAQGTVYGLDGATGKLRWKCRGPGHAVAVTAGSA